MELTRRGWLGLASAAGAAALSGRLSAQEQGKAPPSGLGDMAAGLRLIDRVKAFGAAELADKGFPGMQIALFAGDRFDAAFAVGFADAERKIPAHPDQLFQIGSISKSLLALCLFVLVSQGKADLAARVQDLLPEHPLPPEPITVTHLLEHSSGLPNASFSMFPQVPGGRLWTGFAPGSRYSYCNLGYALLGAIVEKVSGMACGAALEKLVLRPLGMNQATPVIRAADRERFAVGYGRMRDDLPWMPGAPLRPAQWVDFDNPAGSVAATARDMIRYLAFIAGLARGKGAPLFSDALAERFAKPTIAAPTYGPGASYGNGLVTLEVDGRSCFRHTGGMPAFSSAFTLDKEAGVGCHASVNVGGAGGYRPREVTEYACALLRAAAEGRPLPEVSKPSPPPPVERPELYAGRWTGADGDVLAILDRAGNLVVARGGSERPLRAAGERTFVTDHALLPAHRLKFEEDGLLLIGDRPYRRDGRARRAAVPPRLAKLAGLYYSAAAWDPRITVHAVGERLLLGGAEIVEAGDGSWRFADPNGAPERIWFEHPVDGRPQRLNLSGLHFHRFHDAGL